MKNNHWYKDQGFVKPSYMDIIMGDVMYRLAKINIHAGRKVEVR